MAPPPPFVEAVLERVIHPAPPYGDLYAAIEREPAPEPRIAFLGRVTPFKGVAVAIQALALLRSEFGRLASLDVVGPEDGEYGEELRRLARAPRRRACGELAWPDGSGRGSRCACARTRADRSLHVG